jgi:hypothetical protein
MGLRGSSRLTFPLAVMVSLIVAVHLSCTGHCAKPSLVEATTSIFDPCALRGEATQFALLLICRQRVPSPILFPRAPVSLRQHRNCSFPCPFFLPDCTMSRMVESLIPMRTVGVRELPMAWTLECFWRSHPRYGLSLSEPREILSTSSACMHGVRLSLLSKSHATCAGN